MWLDISSSTLHELARRSIEQKYPEKTLSYILAFDMSMTVMTVCTWCVAEKGETYFRKPEVEAYITQCEQDGSIMDKSLAITQHLEMISENSHTD